jgi:hypothetical protein
MQPIALVVNQKKKLASFFKGIGRLTPVKNYGYSAQAQ